MRIAFAFSGYVAVIVDAIAIFPSVSLFQIVFIVLPFSRFMHVQQTPRDAYVYFGLHIV